MIWIDGVRTLVDIVMINHIRIDLVSQVAFSHGVIITQVKDGLYRDQFVMNIIFLLVVEVFGCLH